MHSYLDKCFLSILIKKIIVNLVLKYIYKYNFVSHHITKSQVAELYFVKVKILDVFQIITIEMEYFIQCFHFSLKLFSIFKYRLLLYRIFLYWLCSTLTLSILNSFIIYKWEIQFNYLLFVKKNNYIVAL